jgi:hypothetical protein
MALFGRCAHVGGRQRLVRRDQDGSGGRETSVRLACRVARRIAPPREGRFPFRRVMVPR